MPRCSLCRVKEARYFRAYSGEKLCRGCFVESVEDKVRKAISRYGMFTPEDRIGLALSGGKDSLVLLHILSKMEERFPKSELIAISVDEGIRGYRNEALRIAEEACRELNVEYATVSFHGLYGYTLDEIVATRGGMRDKPSPCSYCGVLRRKVLNVTARELGVTKLALAHNLDDEVQTSIMNLIHGDIYRFKRGGPSSAITHPKFVPRVKPLCLVPERETTLYAYLTDIEFQSYPCPYAAAALRNDVRNTLNRWEEKHPGIKHTLFHSSLKITQMLRGVREALELRECRVCGEPTPHELCAPCLLLEELGCS